MKTLLAAVMIYAPGTVLFLHNLMGVERLEQHQLTALIVLCTMGLLLDFAALLPALAALIGTAAALTHDNSLQAVGSFGCLVLTAASAALFIRRELL